MLETLDYTIRIGSIPTFLYFDMYYYSEYTGYLFKGSITCMFDESIDTKVASLDVHECNWIGAYRLYTK